MGSHMYALRCKISFPDGLIWEGNNSFSTCSSIMLSVIDMKYSVPQHQKIKCETGSRCTALHCRMNKQETKDPFCFIFYVRWREKLQVKGTAGVDLCLESRV